MSTTSEDTSAYAMSQGMAAVIDEHSDMISLEPRTAAGSHQSMNRMENGDVDIAYTTHLAVNDMINGTGEYEGDAFESDIYSVSYYYDIILQQVSPIDSDIETWADMEGQTVYSLDVGSAARTYLRAIHDALGIDVEEYVTFTQSEQPDAFSEGRMDVGTDLRLNFIQPGYIESLYARHDLKLLDFTDEQIEQIENEPTINLETYSADDLPGPDYGGRDEALWSPLSYITFTTGRLDDETMYEFLEVLWNNREELSEYHALLGDLMEEDFLPKNYNHTEIVDVHPGADAFYEDYDMKP